MPWGYIVYSWEAQFRWPYKSLPQQILWSLISYPVTCWLHAQWRERQVSYSLSCDIVDLRYILMSFSEEKLLSPVATVTGTVRKSLRAKLKFGQMSRIFSCQEGSNCTLYFKLQVLCINVMSILWSSLWQHSSSFPHLSVSLITWMEHRNPYSS